MTARWSTANCGWWRRSGAPSWNPVARCVCRSGATHCAPAVSPRPGRARQGDGFRHGLPRCGRRDRGPRGGRLHPVVRRAMRPRGNRGHPARARSGSYRWLLTWRSASPRSRSSQSGINLHVALVARSGGVTAAPGAITVTSKRDAPIATTASVAMTDRESQPRLRRRARFPARTTRTANLRPRWSLRGDTPTCRGGRAHPRRSRLW